MGINKTTTGQQEGIINDARAIIIEDSDILADLFAHALEAAGYRVRTAIRFDDDPGPAIVNYVNSHDVEMVAMTTHGRSGMERMLHGSVAQYLCKHMTVPLMMVRPSKGDAED